MKNKVIDLFGKKIVPNEGVKYSELLEQFMHPFANEFIDVEYIEDIFEFGINAWNFGNMKILMPKEEFKQTINLANREEGINVALLHRMIDYKAEKFKEFSNFIVDYDLKETDADPILSVITQAEDDYLRNMLEAMEHQDAQADFEDNFINRSAIIITPKQPFIDWFSNLNPEEDFMGETLGTNTYLVDYNIDDLDKWIRKKFDTFFKMELEDWHHNKKEWPQKRNYKMFNLWFDVKISENIYDLERKPVLKID